MTMAPGCLKSCPLTTKGEAEHGPPGHWMESEGSEKEKAFLRLWLWICINWMSLEKREGRGELGGQENSERESKLVQGQQCGQSGWRTEKEGCGPLGLCEALQGLYPNPTPSSINHHLMHNPSPQA